jgi:hypothetical protein
VLSADVQGTGQLCGDGNRTLNGFVGAMCSVRSKLVCCDPLGVAQETGSRERGSVGEMGQNRASVILGVPELAYRFLHHKNMKWCS